MSLLCNWFEDWGRSVEGGLGRTGLMILTLVLLVMAMVMFQDLVRASINKTKVKIKWVELVIFIIFTLFVIWFCYLLIE